VYVAAFEQWWRRERDQRITWLASIDDRPVGMLNMLVFTRMPTPERWRSQWGTDGRCGGSRPSRTVHP
jgi:hypothetical protein